MRYLIVLTLLGGCGLNSEYVAKKDAAEMDKYAASCERLGLQKGSKDNAECAVKMYQAERSPR